VKRRLNDVGLHAVSSVLLVSEVERASISNRLQRQQKLRACVTRMAPKKSKNNYVQKDETRSDVKTDRQTDRQTRNGALGGSKAGFIIVYVLPDATL